MNVSVLASAHLFRYTFSIFNRNLYFWSRHSLIFHPLFFRTANQNKREKPATFLNVGAFCFSCVGAKLIFVYVQRDEKRLIFVSFQATKSTMGCCMQLSARGLGSVLQVDCVNPPRPSAASQHAPRHTRDRKRHGLPGGENVVDQQQLGWDTNT